MAQQACCAQRIWCKESSLLSESVLEEQGSGDSLISKLLRWLVAAVIIGNISSKSIRSSLVAPAISNTDTLQSLLKHIKIRQGETGSNDYYSVAKALAAIILHLQHLLGMSCSVLPSVVSALCLLLSEIFDSTGIQRIYLSIYLWFQICGIFALHFFFFNGAFQCSFANAFQHGSKYGLIRIIVCSAFCNLSAFRCVLVRIGW